MIKTYGDTNFITGLRAYAAFAVVFIHAGGGGLREFGTIANHIVDLGAQGVAIFFVISGYSVSVSYNTSKGYWDYLNKRLWRIAPLYYFWIGIAIFFGTTATFWLQQYSTSVNKYNLLMHMSFLTFLDYKITNTLLGVEWTIPIEVFWYLLIPFCMQWMTSHKQLAIAVVLSYLSYELAIKYPNMLDVPAQDAVMAMYWSPVPYIFGFFLGIAAFRLRESGQKLLQWNRLLFIATFITFILVINRLNFKSDPTYIYFSIITFILILFGSDRNLLFRWIFANKIAVFIGSISYGIYLCHLTLLSLLIRFCIVSNDGSMKTFLILSSSAISVSAVSYYLIERPSQSLGKSFYSKFTNKRNSFT